MSGQNLTSGIGTKEKVGYAMGDVASNFYWRVFDVFLFLLKPPYLVNSHPDGGRVLQVWWSRGFAGQ